jgi:hypothetical protein
VPLVDTVMATTSLRLIGARRLSTGDPRGTLGVMSATSGLDQIAEPAFAGFVQDAMGPSVAPSLVATCSPAPHP